MEQGTLNIQKTSKGFAATIQYLKDGQNKNLPVTSWKPANADHHGKTCQFQRDKGQLVYLALSDGLVLLELRNQKTESNEGRSSSRIKDIFDINKTRLPKDVRERLGIRDIDNFYLKLNKAGYFEDTITKDNVTEKLPPEKCKFKLAITSRSGFKAVINPNFGNLNLTEIAQRLRRMALAVCGNKNENLIEYKGQTNWRMAIGLGYESVYETSITLHHIYGIPYIPASTLKGIIRGYIISEVFQNKEVVAIQNQDFCDLFGCPEDLDKQLSFYKEAREGKIIFFDAFPLILPIVEPDVMNPHYGDYYSSTAPNVKAPVDTLSPVPIHFMTVKNTSFGFMAGFKGENKLLSTGKLGNSFSEFLKKYLAETLEQKGVGAKTAVGYGYMKPA